MRIHSRGELSRDPALSIVRQRISRRSKGTTGIRPVTATTSRNALRTTSRGECSTGRDREVWRRPRSFAARLARTGSARRTLRSRATLRSEDVVRERARTQRAGRRCHRHAIGTSGGRRIALILRGARQAEAPAVARPLRSPSSVHRANAIGIAGPVTPSAYGRWVARDDFVRYEEAYVTHHGLAIELGTEPLGGCARRRCHRADGRGDRRESYAHVSWARGPRTRLVGGALRVRSVKPTPDLR